ncbi:TPA: hypothetical protein ACYZ1N_004851, partial [Escherichia coli]
PGGFYPKRKIEKTPSATAIAIPTAVNASGLVIVKHPSRLPVRSVSDTPSPVQANRLNHWRILRSGTVA